jgi:hypothetical protein
MVGFKLDSHNLSAVVTSLGHAPGWNLLRYQDYFQRARHLRVKRNDFQAGVCEYMQDSTFVEIRVIKALPVTKCNERSTKEGEYTAMVDNCQIIKQKEVSKTKWMSIQMKDETRTMKQREQRRKNLALYIFQMTGNRKVVIVETFG